MKNNTSGAVSKITGLISAADKSISAGINGIFGKFSISHPSFTGGLFGVINGYLEKRGEALLIFLLVILEANLILFKAWGFFPVFTALCLLSFIRPSWALALFAFFFVTDTKLMLHGSITVFTGEFMLLTMAPGFIYSVLTGKKYRASSYYGISLMLLYMVFSLVPLAYMDGRAAIIKGLAKGSEIFFIYFFSSMFITELKDLKAVLLLLCLNIFYLFGVCLYQYNFGFVFLNVFSVEKGVYIPRLNGGMGVTAFAAYLNIILPAALLCVLLYGKKLWLKCLAAAAAVLIFSCEAAFPFSRAGWLVLLFTCGACAVAWLKGKFLDKNSKTWLAAVLICSVGLSSIMLEKITNGKALEALSGRTTRSFMDDTDSGLSAMNRGYFFRVALDIFRSHPLGIGTGNYQNYAWKYAGNSKKLDPAFIHHLHNLYLQVLVDRGIISLLVYLALALYLFGLVYRYFIDSTSAQDRAALFFLACCLTAFFIGSFFDVFIIYARGVYVGVLAGVFVAYLNLMDKKV